MQNIHVGIVAAEFPPDIGGVETYSYEFARALANRGHTVTVFTRKHSSGEVAIPGVKVLPVLTLRRLLDREIFQQYQVDIWHIMNAAHSWVALETSPVIASVHGNDFLRPYVFAGLPWIDRIPFLWRVRSHLMRAEKGIDRTYTKWLTRHCLQYVNHIIANSRYTERVLLEKIPGCKGKTSVGLVGVDHEYFNVASQMKNCSGPVKLLTVCRLSEPRKNVDRVIKALAAVREKYNFTYTIVGDGALRQELESLSRRLGLQDIVEFKGRVSQDELKRIFADSDLFVLTSSILKASHEGFGIVYLEAAASGTPSLAARLAGAVEAVEEGVSGYFVDKPSVGEIGFALAQFLSGEIRFDTDTCREHAKRFSWDKVVAHALSVYERALAS